MAWLGYVFSLPGAGVGAIAGAIYLKRQEPMRALVAGAIVGLFTLVGLAANQLIVCKTVMYCGF